MKKILVTGSTGFIGKNLIERFTGHYEFLPYLRETSDEELSHLVEQADMVIHLAGVSRPQDPKEFYEGNSDLTKKLIDALIAQNKTIPLFYVSSIHADMDNDFGKSKRLAEDTVLGYGSTGAPIYIMRLTNTFGKYAKPNAHSVVATFCYNIAHDLDIQISDPSKLMNLAYVDDVVDTIIHLLEREIDPNTKELKPCYFEMTKVYAKTLGEIADTIKACKKGTVEYDEFSQRIQETFKFLLKE